MNKIVLFILSLLICPVIAGLYGCIHNQFTYTVSPEFFTAYMFEKFGFIEYGRSTPRITAGIIGIWSTWWMGIIISFVFSAVGYSQPNAGKMYRSIVKAVLICLSVTISTGLIGLLYGKLGFSELSKTCCFPLQIHDKSNFIAVEEMHNFSYIGGIFGIIGGVISQLWKSKTTGLTQFK